MIRVLHVIGRMAPGGTEHQLIGMLEAAHRHLWDATLCVLSSGWPLTERARDAGIPVVEITGSTRADPRRAHRLRQLGKDADVVHASLPLASTFARLSNLGPGRPALVISERGIDIRRHPAVEVANRLLSRVTDAYIGNSTAVTDYIRSTHGIAADDPRVVAIPNGLDTSIFHPASRPARSIGRQARLLGVGRLIASKRFDLTIGLLPTLSAANDVSLTLIGDGPERPRLQTMARGLPVTFVGHVSGRTQVAEIMRESDVLVMPSAAEGYPNAVLEALGCGLQVVASDIPGIRPAAGDGVRLVPDDAKAWCDAILEALHEGPIPAPHLSSRILSFDEVAARHLDVFRVAIDRRLLTERLSQPQPKDPSTSGKNL